MCSDAFLIKDYVKQCLRNTLKIRINNKKGYFIKTLIFGNREKNLLRKCLVNTCKCQMN